MTTQESQLDVNIYFVVPNDLESEDDCSEEMWLAFNVRIFATMKIFSAFVL